MNASIKWFSDLRWRKAQFLRHSEVFAQPGDMVTGKFIYYDPLTGASDFDGNPCGLLVLEQSDGTWVKLGLGKQSLDQAVLGAVITMESPEYADYPPGSLWIGVKFIGTEGERNWKRFIAAVGIEPAQEEKVAASSDSNPCSCLRRSRPRWPK